MRISTFFYTLKQGIINIFRNKWFSLASVATISACLFLFGLFYAVIANFQSIVKTAEEGVSVTIFFQPGTTEEQMKEIGDKIEAREEVSKVEFTSADEAWDYYRANWIPEEFSDGFPDNPLENSAGDQDGQPVGACGNHPYGCECTCGICVGGHYPDPAACFCFPDKQYRYHWYFCQKGRNQHYEIYRSDGFLCKGALCN